MSETIGTKTAKVLAVGLSTLSVGCAATDHVPEQPTQVAAQIEFDPNPHTQFSGGSCVKYSDSWVRDYFSYEVDGDETGTTLRIQRTIGVVGTNDMASWAENGPTFLAGASYLVQEIDGVNKIVIATSDDKGEVHIIDPSKGEKYSKILDGEVGKYAVVLSIFGTGNPNEAVAYLHCAPESDYIGSNQTREDVPFPPQPSQPGVQLADSKKSASFENNV